ncbi:MAG: hypothetical protein M3Y35_18740 [Actinomycetota bacterium]|nr:hypothetical protein [Actinomycetota bacterium]
MAAEEVATGAVVTASGAEGCVELPDDIAGIGLADDEDVLVAGAALDVLAMTVDVTAGGEELPHAATPISPDRTARTPDAVRRDDFTGAPELGVGNGSRARKGMNSTVRAERQRTPPKR